MFMGIFLFPAEGFGGSRFIDGGKRPVRTVAMDGDVPHERGIFVQREDRTFPNVFAGEESAEIGVGDLVGELEVGSVVFVGLDDSFFEIAQEGFAFFVAGKAAFRGVFEGETTEFPVFDGADDGIAFREGVLPEERFHAEGGQGDAGFFGRAGLFQGGVIVIRFGHDAVDHGRASEHLEERRDLSELNRAGDRLELGFGPLFMQDVFVREDLVGTERRETGAVEKDALLDFQFGRNDFETGSAEEGRSDVACFRTAAVEEIGAAFEDQFDIPFEKFLFLGVGRFHGGGDNPDRVFYGKGGCAVLRLDENFQQLFGGCRLRFFLHHRFPPSVRISKIDSSWQDAHGENP